MTTEQVPLAAQIEKVQREIGYAQDYHAEMAERLWSAVLATLQQHGCAMAELAAANERIARLIDDARSVELATRALRAIHELLDSGGIPRGTFADDHVRNLVALYNQRGERIGRLERALKDLYRLGPRPWMGVAAVTWLEWEAAYAAADAALLPAGKGETG